MSTWFESRKTPKVQLREGVRASKVPEGLWVKCPKCSEILQSRVLEQNLKVCPICQHHFRMTSKERIQHLTDPGSFKEIAKTLKSKDPLEFKDTKNYADRLKSSEAATGSEESVRIGKATIDGLPYCLALFEFRFLGGSMGVVAGEKITRLFEIALKEKIPAVVVSASGGARMQEGILSLMQMAKTSALIEKMRQEGIPYLSVLTDPTTGGVAASFAMLGDLNLAEPNALIGFAGPRVIQQTMRKPLPEGAQRSEYVLQRGFIDRIIERKHLARELRSWMWRLGRYSCGFPKGLEAS